MNAALYARVSTGEGRQHIENQLRQLRLYAAKMGWPILKEFTDGVSGAAEARPGLQAMMAAAVSRQFDVVLVFDLSRLTRRGVATAFEIIERLRLSGVQFWSMNEEYFRTTGPAGPLLIAIAAYIAEQERIQIQARINAGLARARAQGKTLGRPREVVDAVRLRELRAGGLSIRELARRLRTSRGTIERRLNQLEVNELANA